MFGFKATSACRVVDMHRVLRAQGLGLRVPRDSGFPGTLGSLELRKVPSILFGILL